MRLSRRALGWLNLRYRSVISHMRVGEPCMGAWWCDQCAKIQSILDRLKKKVVKMKTRLFEHHARSFDLEQMEPRVLLNGDPTYGLSSSYNWGAGYSGQVMVVDLNNDGAPELIRQPASQDSHYRLLENNGDGTFGTSEVLPTAGGYGQVIFEDLNEDGYLDMISVGSSPARVGISLNDQSGGFGEMNYYATGNSPVGVGLADFDNDGIDDLMVTHGEWVPEYDSYGGVRFLKGNSDGTFEDYVTAYPLENSESYYSDGSYVLHSGDLDADGNADLLMADYYGYGVSFLKGAGDGSFISNASLGLYTENPTGLVNQSILEDI